MIETLAFIGGCEIYKSGRIIAKPRNICEYSIQLFSMKYGVSVGWIQLSVQLSVECCYQRFVNCNCFRRQLTKIINVPSHLLKSLSPSQLRSFQWTQQNRRLLVFYLRAETDPVSGTLCCFRKSQTAHKAQKLMLSLVYHCRQLKIYVFYWISI